MSWLPRWRRRSWPQLDARVSRDADDDAVLACALAARADLIVSGDDDLLSIKTFNSIPIVSVAHAVKGFAATA